MIEIQNNQSNSNGQSSEDIQDNISSHSSLDNNIDSFENRRRISYQDHHQQSHNNQRSNRGSSRYLQNDREQQQQHTNTQINQVLGNMNEVDMINLYQIEGRSSRRAARSDQIQNEIKQSSVKSICKYILNTIFNYSLWIYLACNIIVIVNQFINKSDRNFTLIFWTLTSILFIIIRLIQTCVVYQREQDDFTNLVRNTSTQRSRITRRSRLSRLYPRRQLHTGQIPVPVAQIIQQIYYNSRDLESQSEDRSLEITEIAHNLAEQTFLQSDQNVVESSIQQIWIDSFRQQMAQQGVNSNVMILQQRIEDQKAKGLSRGEIKKFEKISYTQEQLDSLQEQDIICSICLDKYESDKKLIKLPCTHTYHNHCITKWLLQDQKCPLCRLNLKSQQ
ncbi:hypothetical protein ABPG74_010067 [Tetrahymena malaccensis]